jgi:hypothetical protein
VCDHKPSVYVYIVLEMKGWRGGRERERERLVRYNEAAAHI